MAKLRLSIATGDYDIIRPLKEGLVEAAGIELIFLTDMGPRERHWRLARKSEFDICEENVGAYFIAREQGHAITGIPVFLHRRFRHGFVFVNTNSGIKTPKDLIGKPIGGTNFMPAGNIWMRGILEEHYGVPHRQNIWIVDYKTNRPPPVDPEQVAEAYLLQLAAYRLAVGRIFPGTHVRAAILWTDGPRIMEIRPEVLDAQQQRLWRLEAASLDA